MTAIALLPILTFVWFALLSIKDQLKRIADALERDHPPENKT